MKLVSVLFLAFICFGNQWGSTDELSPIKTSIDKPEIHDYLLIDTLMADFLDKTKVPGVSMSVNRGGEIIYSKGFGFADVKQEILMQPTSQIRTASVAKVITATALGKLVTEGKLDLDAPLKEYISYIQEPYSSLTARQLAGHTAGVQHSPSSNKIKKKHYSEIKESVDFLFDMPLLFEPNTDYKYSTLGYNLLAALIEEISGKRYVDYMREDIFIPLNMTQTFPDNSKTEFLEEDAKMYFFRNGKLILDQKIVDGSYKLAGAGFKSTSQDLAKMMDAYSNGFIADEVVQTMFTSNILNNGNSTNVGITWRINQDINNELTIEHAGSWQGARTVIVYYPEYQLTVSIMINAKCTVFIEETAQLIAQLFLEKEKTNTDLAGIDESLTITNNKLDGSTEVYNGRLKFAENNKGEFSMDIDKEWLRKNNFYYLSTTGNFALSTEHGLLYLRLKPNLEGELFLYQLKNDMYHMNQKPMLYFHANH